ncbi:MAG: hypothetical protein KFF73_01385 [Cyclobacteriaceae bacterium]|nr:hypothetical protein [Cyclobacteriaceae bacterium]
MKNFSKIIAILSFGTIGWVLSGLIFYFARMFLGNYLAVLVHFVFSPLAFIGLSYLYFRYINITSSLITAAFVTGIVIGLDFFVIGLLIEKNFRIFTSIMGTWLPFLLIFLSVFLTGLNFNDRSLS